MGKYIEQVFPDNYPTDSNVENILSHYVKKPPSESDPGYASFRDHSLRGVYLNHKLRWELTPMQNHPQPGMRPRFTADNPLLYRDPLIKMLDELDLVDKIPYWVHSIPEYHPRYHRMNGASQQVCFNIFYEMCNNPHSTIPRLPEFTIPLYLVKWVDLLINECPVWDLGLVAISHTLTKYNNRKNSSSEFNIGFPQSAFRCLCPLSRKFKNHHEDNGLNGFFSHCGKPHCNETIFHNPTELIDHVLDKSQHCIFYFIIDRLIKHLYQDIS